MKRVCRELQELIAGRGAEALRTDRAAERHLADCADCFEFLEAFAELDSGLAELPRLDAPDPVVADLLRRPELAGPAVPGAAVERIPKRAFRPRFLAWSGVTAVVLLLALFAGNRQLVERTIEEQVPLAVSIEQDESDKLPLEREVAALKAPAPKPAPEKNEPFETRERIKVTASRQLVDLESTETESRFNEEFIADLPVPGRFYQNLLTYAPGVGDDRAVDDPNIHGSRDRDFAAIVGGMRAVDLLAGQSESKVNPNSIEEIEKIIVVSPEVEFAPEQHDARTAAREFLRRRVDSSGLTFLEPEGYWSNTYVPGDPAFRLLQARLQQSDRSELQQFATAPLSLHDAARAAGQPFDAPDGAALAVYLHADRRGVEEQGRLLLQVGLQATERQGGRRPAMNVTLVLDLRGEVPDAVAQNMRALVMAFGQARDVGDRFSIVVAGRRGGIVVESVNFRHGYLGVTLDRLLNGDDDFDAPALGLVDAVSRAIETATAGDDQESPLGSSAVVLITGQPLGSAAQPVAELAHLSAVAGVPFSAVGVGSEIALEQIDRLALAGQGHRRLLSSPGEAEGLVDRELSAVGRAVARAVRLRIRLAPGVRLVEVVGSERLDAVRADRVREAEQSIDRRIARNLGIQADRGEDEDGIQIVIPSFYAGDSHVVLLDVTAAGPGTIADVGVRYKDLVYLRNGVARASLSLDDELRAPGPLERNVLKNFLAQRLSRQLAQAGRALAAGNVERAASLLTETRELFTGLCIELPDLAGDYDLQNDIRMLDEYAALLNSDATSTPALRAQLSDSLLYAGRLKVLSAPDSN